MVTRADEAEVMVTRADEDEVMRTSRVEEEEATVTIRVDEEEVTITFLGAAEAMATFEAEEDEAMVTFKADEEGVEVIEDEVASVEVAAVSKRLGYLGKWHCKLSMSCFNFVVQKRHCSAARCRSHKARE